MLAFAEEELARTTALHARRDVGDEPALEGRLSVRQGIALTQQALREIIMPTLRAMVEARTAAA
jgi:hypothetical protein